ncbi:MAG: methyl-accepting chemotaxis protein [Bdellovibrionota bacterium]
MSFKNLSFRNKIIAMIVLITAITCAGAGTSFWITSSLQKRYKAMIAKNDYLEITTSNISDQLHIMGREEIAFTLRGSPAAITARETAAANLDLFLGELQAIDVEFLTKAEVSDFAGDIAKYKNLSKELIEQSKVHKEKADEMSRQMIKLSVQLSNLLKSIRSEEGKKLASEHSEIQNQEFAFLGGKDFTRITTVKTMLADLQTKIQQSNKINQSSKKALLGVTSSAQDIVAKLYTSFEQLDKSEKDRATLMTGLEDKMQNIFTKVRAFNEQEIKSLDKLEILSSLSGALVLVASVLIAFITALVILKISNTLLEISNAVRKSAVETKNTSHFMHGASEKVSMAAGDQASAIQETVATLNQISAMVSKSVESATASADRANASYHIAKEGKTSVVQVRHAMQEIQSNINDMTVQVDASNKGFEGIVAIISEIVLKTQVIHDIVFQTKLLSFNASVEAARAGEHGKGFAVVAEEVGNLAQMSGQAAREINDLLSKSRADVEQIVSASKTQMQVLVQKGGERVKHGSELANRCEAILEEVVVNVDSVKTLMAEIATAAKEEAEGVHNITIAMNEIDASTHANSDLAHQTMGHSKQLANQADELADTVYKLDSLVSGVNKAVAISNSEMAAPEPVKPVKPAHKASVIEMGKFKASSSHAAPKSPKAAPNQKPSADDPGFEEVS